MQNVLYCCVPPHYCCLLKFSLWGSHCIMWWNTSELKPRNAILTFLLLSRVLQWDLSYMLCEDCCSDLTRVSGKAMFVLTIVWVHFWGKRQLWQVVGHSGGAHFVHFIWSMHVIKNSLLILWKYTVLRGRLWIMIKEGLVHTNNYLWWHHWI